MEFKDIIALTKAGWTKEEILMLAGGKAQSDEGNKEKDGGENEAGKSGTEGTKEAEPKKKEQDDEGTKAAKNAIQPDVLAGVIKQMQDLTAAIQASNIVGQSVDRVETETADDILANIINPKED